MEGREPFKKDLKKYREKGEERGRQLMRSTERAAVPTAPAPDRRKSKKVNADLDHPRVLREEGDRMFFAVPLTSNTKDIPVDKFWIEVVVNRATRHLERASMRVLDSFRLKLVAKVKSGEASADFTVVDPQYGPVMTSVTGDFALSLLLVPVKGTVTMTRTEWKRVKPYDERFQVKAGPLQALDF